MKTVKIFLEKLIVVEKKLAAEQGDFVLFGIFLREYAPNNRWDIVVSAPWLDESSRESLDFIIKKFMQN